MVILLGITSKNSHTTGRFSNHLATPLMFDANYVYTLHPCTCALVVVRKNEPRGFSLFSSYNHTSMSFIDGPTQSPHLTVEYRMMQFPLVPTDHVVIRS